MGLLASLRRALLGGGSTRRTDDQPSELTAVAPDFTGFVSNRAPSPASDQAMPAAAEPGSEPPADGGEPGPARQPAPAGSSELTTVAPEFSGRVSNRPQAGQEEPPRPPAAGVASED